MTRIVAYILTFTFTLAKFFTFSNLFEEKPGNVFAIAKMREKHQKEKESLSKTTCILT